MVPCLQPTSEAARGERARQRVTDKLPGNGVRVGLEPREGHESPALPRVQEPETIVLHKLPVETLSQEVPPVNLVRSSVCAHQDSYRLPWRQAPAVAGPRQEIWVHVHAERFRG